MDPRRRTISQDAPQSTRRPGIPRASVAPGSASGAMLSASVQQGAGRYSMAPQRGITRPSMAPPPVPGSSMGVGAIPGTASRIGHTYASQQVPASAQRGDGGYLRQSHAPASAQQYQRPSERRSSHGRRSSNPSHQSTLQAFVSLYGAQRPGLKDPRNLRNDAVSRGKCGAEVADFLVERRYPGDTRVTQQTITQKDFEATFKFLYTLFDPAHGPWVGKFEDEVIKKCLPTCGYPFASEVNRSALITVGAKHSWFAILGLLHWLVVAIRIREAAFELYPEVRIDPEAIDQEDGLERPQAKVEFWAEYLSRSYPLFLASEDYESSLEPHIARLKDRYDAHQERSHQHILELKDTSDELELEIKRIDALPNELELRQQEHAKLQKDVDTLDAFMATLNKRAQHVKKQLEEFHKRIKELEEAKRLRQTERAQLQSQVNEQNLSDADIQRLTTDRMNLDEQSRALTDKELSLSKEGADLEVDLRRVMNRVEKHTDDYTSRLSRHGLLPKTGPGEYEHVDFAQEINGSAVAAAEIAPDSAKSAAIRPALIRMRQQAQSERNRHIDAALLVETELGKLNERIAEVNERLADLDAEHQTQKEQLDTAKDTLTSEMHNANLELERRERENLEVRNNLSGGNLGADQRLQALEHEHTRLQAAVERVRKENTDALAESLDMIISFKDFAKNKIEDMYSHARE